MAFQIRPLDEGDKDWVVRFLETQWDSARVVTRGRLHYPSEMPGFLAIKKDSGKRLGLITYRIEIPECEIVTLNSIEERIGVGTVLVSAVKDVAVASGCRRMWVITTNDNVNAIGFYQKRGFRIAAIHLNALEQSRRLKPEIPFIGKNGIPLRDEIELETLLP